MNWFASQLRNQLNKEKLAHTQQLNHLITNSKSVKKFRESLKEKKDLEEQLNLSQKSITNAQQAISNLQTEIFTKEKNLKDLKTKISQLQTKHKEERFTLQKQNRDYWFYHQREIKRLAPDLKAKVAELKEQKGQLLNNIRDLESQLSQKIEALERSLQKEANNKAKITSLQNDLADLNLLLERAKEEAKTLTKRIKDLQKDKEKLRKESKAKETELLKQIQTANTQITNLEKQIKALTILANHRLELLEQEKQALIDLAKKKIQNKKEASQLLAQLQTSWSEEKATILTEHQQEKANLITEHQSEQTKLNSQIEAKNSTISTLQFNLAFKESVVTDLSQKLRESNSLLAKLCTNFKEHLERIDN